MATKNECELCGDVAELELHWVTVGKEPTQAMVCHNCCHCEKCGKLITWNVDAHGYSYETGCGCFEPESFN